MGKFEDEVVKATSRTMDMLLWGMSIETLRAMHLDALYARDHCPKVWQDRECPTRFQGSAWYNAWNVLAWHIADVIERRTP